MGCNLLTNGVYWGYNPLTNLLLTSRDIQVAPPQKSSATWRTLKKSKVICSFWTNAVVVCICSSKIWEFCMVSSFRNRVKQIPSRERFLPTTVFEEVFEMWKQLPNLPKQVSDCELKASGPSGPHFLVMGHHAGPMGNSNPANQLLRKYLAMNQPPAWGVCCFCWSWWFGHMSTWTIGSRHSWFEIYRRQRWWNAALFGHDFHDFLLCFMRGVPKIPYRCCPTFLMIFTIIVLAGWTEHVTSAFSWYFFLVIDLDDFASQKQKHDLDPPPQPVTKKV